MINKLVFSFWPRCVFVSINNRQSIQDDLRKGLPTKPFDPAIAEDRILKLSTPLLLCDPTVEDPPNFHPDLIYGDIINPRPVINTAFRRRYEAF